MPVTGISTSEMSLGKRSQSDPEEESTSRIVVDPDENEADTTDGL